MTENKRFTLEDNHVTYRIRDNGAVMKIPKIVDLLNELYETNEELKSQYSEQCIQLDFLKDENSHMKSVLEENEQLKQQLDECREQRAGIYTTSKKSMRRV